MIVMGLQNSHVFTYLAIKYTITRRSLYERGEEGGEYLVQIHLPLMDGSSFKCVIDITILFFTRI